MDDSSYFTIRIPKPTRRWLQFSLATFLIVSVLAGIIFGVFGRRLQRGNAAETHVRVYNVADLVVPKRPAGPFLAGPAVADFDGLLTKIRKTVAPKSWDTVGGTGAIETFPTNLSVVVSQSEEIHEELADFLKAERQVRSAPPANQK